MTPEEIIQTSDTISKINKIQNDIRNIRDSIDKVKATNDKTKDEISKLPDGKTKYNLEINRLQTSDLALIELDYKQKNLEAQAQYTAKVITEETYRDTLSNNTLEYRRALRDNENQQEYYQKLLLANPDAKQKEENNKQKRKKQSLTRKISSDQTKGQSQRLASIVKNSAIVFIPIIVELLSQKLSNSVFGLTKINDRIDALNEEIDQFNNSNSTQTIQVLIDKKNALINDIQNIENKILNIRNFIDILNVSLQIFAVALALAQSINASLPVASAQLQLIIDRISPIVAALITIIPIITSLLNKVINDLEEARLRIKEIENKIENKANNNPEVADSFISSGLLDVEYKGFKFAVREENTLGSPTINRVHRHYGVAIDTNNVEVLKTDPSFTQDTQVLVDLLKFIIDSQNLKA
jgi:hypothetical protein